MALLPGISSVDISHLQRTIHIALHCDDAATRADARQLLDWLTEHNALAEKRFDTSHPGAFAQALHRTAPRNVMKPGGMASYRTGTQPGPSA